MSQLEKFQKFSIPKMEQKEVKGAIDWRAVCGGLYAVVGMAQWEGDGATASAAWTAWTNMGCAQY